MSGRNKIVRQLLGEAPVDHQDVGNPGAAAPQMRGFSKKYTAVKLEDFEPSDELDEFLGEASKDGSTYDDAGIEWLATNGPEPLRQEISELHAAMKAVNATILILV